MVQAVVRAELGTSSCMPAASTAQLQAQHSEGGRGSCRALQC